MSEVCFLLYALPERVTGLSEGQRAWDFSGFWEEGKEFCAIFVNFLLK